ncbi:MAG: (Dimethylallyl)adenosine tRNA methylthiotransferase MiaB [Firmicutes bacterium ADurb.Bin419]|nr:MAG: (Dimethylallyl)adenosine tRNA methylthiotransferase MiaB [Firmicutes bacterium ADurb.Bin419]
MDSNKAFKIALIWPGSFDTSYVMPLGFAYLKAHIPSEHNVKVIDLAINKIDCQSEEFKEMFQSFNPDIVGISCWSFNSKEAFEIAKTVKCLKKDVKVIMGGIHSTVAPGNVIENENVDFVLRGEGEISFPALIREIQKGTAADFSNVNGLVFRDGEKVCYNDIKITENLDELKLPDYDAIDLERYLQNGYRIFDPLSKRNAPVLFTRGCPYSCNYCSGPIVSGRKIRKHSVDYMVEWVKYLYFNKNIRLVTIIDDNFTFDVKFAKEFCRRIIDLNLENISFSTPNGIHIQHTDSELFELMRKAGWRYLTVAPESGSQNTLKLMNKKVDLSIYKQKIKEIKAANIKVHAFFIVGYPGETKEDLMLTKRFIKNHSFDAIFINNFQPLPYTPVFNQLVANGEISTEVIPKNYANGVRVYKPKELKDFDFPKYILGIYLSFALRNPGKIVYSLKVLSVKRTLKNLLSQLGASRIKRRK